MLPRDKGGFKGVDKAGTSFYPQFEICIPSIFRIQGIKCLRCHNHHLTGLICLSYFQMRMITRGLKLSATLDDVTPLIKEHQGIGSKSSNDFFIKIIRKIKNISRIRIKNEGNFTSKKFAHSCIQTSMRSNFANLVDHL